MEHFNDTQKLQILERIANHLMLKTSSSDDLGLYNGKIGVVLFFYHYAKHTDNQLYDDFAGLILDEIYNEMHELLPIAFSNGICGIAWSVNYLLKNNFVEGDPEVILKELDKRIMKQDVRRMDDQSFETGLEGLNVYIRSRLSSCSDNGNVFDPIYLQEVLFACQDFSIKNDQDILRQIINESKFDLNNISQAKLGMSDGCSGFGLKLIFS